MECKGLKQQSAELEKEQEAGMGGAEGASPKRLKEPQESFFFFKIIFLCEPYLKSLLSLLQYCLFYVLFFWP